MADKEEIIYASGTVQVECPKCEAISETTTDDMDVFTEKYYGNESTGIEVQCSHCNIYLRIKG